MAELTVFMTLSLSVAWEPPLPTVGLKISPISNFPLNSHNKFLCGSLQRQLTLLLLQFFVRVSSLR